MPWQKRQRVKATIPQQSDRGLQQHLPRKRKKGSVKEYFKGVKLEMKKVVWPTKKELGSFTAVVLVTCAAFAVVFWAVDTGVLAAIKDSMFLKRAR